MVASRGTLRQQLAATTPVIAKPRLLSPSRQFLEEPSAPLPFMELKYFNGLGGFTEDGKEFVIYLAPDQQTPLPWVNIMANSKFGALVSESGADFVWGSNSQNDRLTPWFNDRSPIRPVPRFTFVMMISVLSGRLRLTRSGRRMPIAHDTGRVTQALNTTAMQSNKGWLPLCRLTMPAACECVFSGCAFATVRRAGGS